MAPQSQITSGQGSATAKLADGWPGVPGWHLPKVWLVGGKGQVQGADIKARPGLGGFELHHRHQQHSLTPQGHSSWPAAPLATQGGSCGLPAGLSPQSPASSHPPGARQDLVKRRRQTTVKIQRCVVGSGAQSRYLVEKAATKPGAKHCHVALLPDT